MKIGGVSKDWQDAGIKMLGKCHKKVGWTGIISYLIHKTLSYQEVKIQSIKVFDRFEINRFWIISKFDIGRVHKNI